MSTKRDAAELITAIDDAVAGTGLWPIVHPLLKQLADRSTILTVKVPCRTCGGTRQATMLPLTPYTPTFVGECPDCTDGTRTLTWEQTARLADFFVRAYPQATASILEKLP